MAAARPQAPPEPPAAPATVVDGAAEWLLVDGRSGYACGCADDLPRRRYHGLWVAARPGSARRCMVVAGLDERILRADDPGGERAVRLMHAHWHGQAAPSPPDALVRFTPRPLPRWAFQTDAGTVLRTVALRRTEGADDDAPVLLVRWQNPGPASVRLSVRPLLGWCDADHLPRAPRGDGGVDFDGTVHARGASWGVQPSGLLPPLWLTVDGVAAFRGDPVWYHGFDYASDRARGYDHVGDRYSPGVLEVDVPPGGDAVLAFRLGEPCAAPAALFDAVEAAALQRWRTAASAAAPHRARLALGADDFLYRAAGDRLGVLAGFPWFGEWGRDVFVALPGLTLARGRRALCAEVLTGALPFLRRGLLPNIYGREPADSHYGSCDAALWFALACMRFADDAAAGPAPAGHVELVRERLVPALAGIADACVAGTDLGVAAEPDGLLRAGRADLNATWMDARVDGVPVTPRAGLPVEIQALWYALLAFLAESGVERFAPLRDRCRKAFVRAFWLADGEYLADRVHDGIADRSVRPNMLVAAALPRAPLSHRQRAGIVAKATAELVTPRGLRTLSPHDPAYVGRYEGGVAARDRAYHQGTVWPWLAGFYVEAALAAAGRRAQRKTALALSGWLDELCGEIDRAGIDHVSEVFDGDPPHRPGGTFAQAWNTGELLRAFSLCDAALAGGGGASEPEASG